MKLALAALALVVAAATPSLAQYEVRKYAMEDRRAYGGPSREYILITPAPPANVLHVQGPRGTARVVIDDRPSINHPAYIPVLK